MKLKKTFTILAAALIAAFVFGACDSSVAFDKAEYTVKAGQELEYSVDTGLTYTLSSDDPDILAVEGKTVTGVKPGETVLRVNAGGYKAEAKVTVTAAETLTAPVLYNDFEKLMWDAVDNAEGYVVTVDGAAKPQQTATEYAFTGLTKGSHTFKVKAIAPANIADSAETEKTVNILEVAYKADIAAKPADLFTYMGTAEYNDDGTVSLFNVDDGGAFKGPATYFGQNTTEGNKNFAWVAGGYTATMGVYLDPADFENGKGFNVTLSINNKSLSYMTERSIYIGKTSDELKAGYVFNGTDEALNAEAVSKPDAAVIPSAGWYTVVFKYYPVTGGELKADISLQDARGVQIFGVTGESFNAGTTDETAGGLRYMWVSYMGVDTLNVNSVMIFKNA